MTDEELAKIEALLARIGLPPWRGFDAEEIATARARAIEIGDRIGVTLDLDDAALVRHAYGFRLAALAKRGIGPRADGTFIPASEDTVAAHVYDYMAERERQVVADLSVHTLIAEVRRLRAELAALRLRGRPRRRD